MRKYVQTVEDKAACSSRCQVLWRLWFLADKGVGLAWLVTADLLELPY